MTAKQNLYEGMFIISAKLSDEARQKAVDRIKKEITDRGGEITKTHDMGRRRMAYGIKKQKEGHYFLFYFQAPTAAIVELWKEFRLHEDLIRFMTLCADSVREKLEFKQIEIPN